MLEDIKWKLAEGLEFRTVETPSAPH